MARMLCVIIGFLITLSGCSQPTPEIPATMVTYPAQNPDTYDPGPGWSLTWEDNFDGTRLDPGKWTRQVMPEPFNEEWQSYGDDPANSYVEDEYLFIKAIHHGDRHGDKQYTSARLNTAGKAEWQYGKFAARIQLPHGAGVWPAFWMLGANIDENGGDTPWPMSGEIDIIELYGSKDDGVVEANIHYDDNGHTQMGAVPYRKAEGRFADAFHVFELEWNAREITWRVDGETFHRTPIDRPEMSEFHQPFFILLNLAIGGTWAGRPDETTPFPSLMVVDWVRVYQPAPPG